ALEVLSHVQIWYVEKETRDLVRIQQCDLLESFHRAQSDYALSTGLAVVSEVSELVLPEHETAESMFRLILLVVREIDRRGDWSLPLAYFAFWAVRLGGWLPPFDQCGSCHAPFGARAAYYARGEGGLRCEKGRSSTLRPVHFEARQLAERFTRQGLDKIEGGEGLAAPARELREAALTWIEHHTERKL